VNKAYSIGLSARSPLYSVGTQEELGARIIMPMAIRTFVG
jgi:hypothetical protein